MILEILKTSYCFFVMELVLNCSNGKQLDYILDKLIDENPNRTEFDFVEGDNDVREVFKYVYQYRCYNLSITETKPNIELKTLLRVLKKSLL